jgi:hypothetical protein
MKYTLVITIQEVGVFEVNKLRYIEADSMIELLAKFPLAVAELQNLEHEEEMTERIMGDDDIPF